MKLFMVAGSLSSCMVSYTVDILTGQRVRGVDASHPSHRREHFLAKGGRFEVLIVALSAECAKRKAPAMFRGDATVEEVMEISRNGTHRRFWCEKKRDFVVRHPGDPTKDTGRLITREVRSKAEIAAMQEGYADAKRLYTPRKKLAASLRASKKHKEGHRAAYERAFSWMWERLASRPFVGKKKPALCA